ncbi:MAG: flagellin [SAR86 cluster bacterium]|uniref:Flagellin n=1 Tax=SAR86 cluster bacterium TaxID=2030880 RepID=A0A2A5B6J1_9GAMM|nr:MAG: flagellin [SAR86 cluster bacterium]
MAQVINTNIASLNAQRNLTKSQGMLSTSLQRLSSGMRINSAKDDAAGLAISERFTSQIRGLNQAARNANDGISLAQTAEGSLAEVTNNLQRIRELAVQSSNATNSSSDRVAMQAEVTQLLAEVERVATQTNFNGVKLLDGSFSTQAFQVGANVGESITVASILDATASGLGLDDGGIASRTNGTAVTAVITDGDLTVNGANIGSVARDAKLIAAAITDSSATVTATATNSVATGAFTAVTGDSSGDTYTITVAGVDIQGTSSGSGISAAAMDTAINSTVLASLASAGITTTGTFDAGTRAFIDADGDNIIISEAHVDSADSNNAGGIASGTGTNYGSVNSIVSSAGDLVIGGNDATKAGLTGGTVTASVNSLTVTTVTGSQSMITAIDTAIDLVNSSRGVLGAIQNRFESVVTSLQTSAESMSAARSRIQDTDFAAETANLTKAQILQQAGMAMVSQANSLPQNVLSLLQ